MINLFDVNDKKLVPSIHCYGIPWLKRIMDNFPKEYIDIYKYIFYTTCPDSTLNPYVNMPEETREAIIITDIKPTFWLEDLMIIDTMEKCRKMYETPTFRAWRAAKKGVDKIADWLDVTEITEGKDGSGTLYNTYMSKIADYNKQYKDLEEELHKEQAKVRGGAKIRYDQMPGYTDTKADTDEED